MNCSNCMYYHVESVKEHYGVCTSRWVHVDADYTCREYVPKKGATMQNDPKVEKLIESVGALSEIAGQFYKQFQAVGFNEAQAMDMTKHMLDSLFKLCVG